MNSPQLSASPQSSPRRSIRTVIERFEADATALQNAALTHLELAEVTLCPMEIGKAIRVLESELTPKPHRVVPEHSAAVEILREARRNIFRDPELRDFPVNSELNSVFSNLVSVAWPADHVGTVSRLDMRIYAVLWANARSVAELTGRGVHHREIADQLGLDWKKELYPELTRLRKYALLAPAGDAGMVRMTEGVVAHFLGKGVPPPRSDI